MPTNYKNTVYKYIDDQKITFPLNVTGSGTIDIAAGSTNVQGTSSAFLAEAKIGGWIFDSTHDELRKITAITSDTYLSIDRPFSNALSGVTPEFVPPSVFTEICALVPSGNSDGEIDGEVLIAGVAINFTKSGRSTGQPNYIDPLILNAGGTIMVITGLI